MALMLLLFLSVALQVLLLLVVLSTSELVESKPLAEFLGLDRTCTLKHTHTKRKKVWMCGRQHFKTYYFISSFFDTCVISDR